jgi:hypothetical protein
MAEIFFYAIIVYLGYRLLFDLLVPVFRNTIKMRQHFGQARSSFDQQKAQASTGGPTPGSASKADPAKKKSRVGEYIDFEEVK